LLRAFDFSIVAEPRSRFFDLEERLWPGSNDPARVVIVDIDEDSLARYGQWPWPRTLVARLVRRIAEGRPRVLGIDIVFAEPDRLSPPQLAKELGGLPAPLASELAQLPSNDRVLAEAISKIPTVLPLVTGREDKVDRSDPLRTAPIRQSGDDPLPFLKEYKSLLRSLPELETAAQGAGAIAAEPDADGIVRRVGLAARYRGTVIPGFALEVLRVGGAERSVVIDTGPFGITGVRIGGVAIPTDGAGRAIPHFAPRLARYISALDVLDPAFDPTKLQSKIALLAVTGLGVADLQQIPQGLVQGVEVHAQLIESVLLETLLHRPPSLDLIEVAVALLSGLTVIWLLPYGRPVRAVVIALAGVAGLIGLELALFGLAGVLFDGTYPAVTLLAAFGVMLVGTLRAAEAELAREREAKQRYEGELAAAQAIQMGLLPRRFPAFPDRPDIDIYARIEPARMVGGDLYDYLLIDGGRRLFFLIADVSGKGAPAALLMASTKEVVREAVLKFGAALDRVFVEANRKTAIANADLESEGGVFATAFAGILELESGNVTYASAGHHAPFVLGGHQGPRQLITDGGPPFGTVDEFPYPMDHSRIEAGELLLLYTDGVTEAEDADHTLYGCERLARALTNAPATEPRGVVSAVIEDLRRFVGQAEQADDITLLALRRVAVGDGD
jgi:serine phosphatase RsbU (regulator of sigma subunit)/CHASE2 domain-containing sensor protein